MKNLSLSIVSLVVAAGAFVAADAVTACTPGQIQAAKTALDVATVACVVANQALADADVAKVCNVANDLIPAMQQILSRSRTASAQAVAGAKACPAAGSK